MTIVAFVVVKGLYLLSPPFPRPYLSLLLRLELPLYSRYVLVNKDKLLEQGFLTRAHLYDCVAMLL